MKVKVIVPIHVMVMFALFPDKFVNYKRFTAFVLHVHQKHTVCAPQNAPPFTSLFVVPMVKPTVRLVNYKLRIVGVYRRHQPKQVLLHVMMARASQVVV
jgi:hypothetical protein